MNEKKFVSLHDFYCDYMKKILVILTMFVALATTAKAQFTDFGFRGGVGFATHTDDLANNGPVLGANLGAFINFGFTNSQSLLAEVLSIQTGLNLVHRGSTYEEVLEKILSVRQGSYSAWYVQLPIMAAMRMELPIREPGHFGLVNIGPAFNYGIFGQKNEIIFTHGYPQSDWNHKIAGEDAFKDLERFGVSFLLGVGYEYQDLQVMLQLDYGMTASRYDQDAILEGKMVPMGNNCSLLLTVGYKFPIR